MPVPGQQDVDDVEKDLNRLERGIREMKIAYDRFFAGAMKREPLHIKFELAKIIKRYNEKPLRTYGHRFRFNSLVARYNVLNEILLKGVRRHEGGDQRHNAQQQVDLGLVSRCRVADPDKQSDALRGVYKEFVQQRIRNGVPNARVPFERFVRGVQAQADRLKATSGCEDVEVRLVVRDQKVQLSARPVSGHAGPAARAKAKAQAKPKVQAQPKAKEAPAPAVPATATREPVK